MPTALLRTKLHIPPMRPREHVVPRPHLIERLNEGLRQGRKLVLVSAPAGFGKTTLLSEWVHAAPALNACWLSLDEGDNDPTRFWAYLVASLQTVTPGLGQAVLDTLQAPGFDAHPPPPEAVLTTLINDLTTLSLDGNEDGPCLLVLDDYHLIRSQPVHDGLVFLVDNMPPRFALVLASRADPPWPLARIRVRGELTEIRAPDLRFRPQEAAAFLNDLMGLALSAQDIDALDARTEGWIAGLQLAALSMQGRDAHTFVKTFGASNRFILDYLVEEVLDRQPREIQSFLLQTSILERFTAPLCDAVTGRGEQGEKARGELDDLQSADSQGTLESLERANLFVVPLDDRREWYRYHHLFADLLRSRLGQTQPERLPTLHSRASAWYEQSDLLPEAVSHALAANDVARVAGLAEKNVLEMLDRGQLSTLVGWLEALPDDAIRSRPWLNVARAWALAHTGALDAAATSLLDAEGAIVVDGTQDADPEADHIKGHTNAIRCYIEALSFGDFERGIALARQSLAQLPEDDTRARGLVAVLLGLLYRNSRDYAAAKQVLDEALVICRAANQRYGTVDVLCQIARVEANQGHLRQAAETCREALRTAETYGSYNLARLPVVSYALASLSGIHKEWDELDAAQARAEEAIALAEQWKHADSLIGGYLALADVYAAQGAFDRALRETRKAEHIGRQLSPERAVYIGTIIAGWQLRQHNVESAVQWMGANEPHIDHESKEWLTICIHIAQFLEGTRRSLDETRERLDRLLDTFEATGSWRAVIEILAAQAVALHLSGRTDQALATLSRALSLGESEGYVHSFVDWGDPMRELLIKAVQSGIRPGYANRLLGALNASVTIQGHPLVPLASAQRALAEPLSTRETEVLRLLDTELSSSEIARELYISQNTVRTHIRNIYGKLDVHARDDAVQRARELGLI